MMASGNGPEAIMRSGLTLIRLAGGVKNSQQLWVEKLIETAKAVE